MLFGLAYAVRRSLPVSIFLFFIKPNESQILIKIWAIYISKCAGLLVLRYKIYMTQIQKMKKMLKGSVH